MKKKRNSECLSSTLVKRVQQLLQNKDFWVVKHVFKEVNFVTDKITKMAPSNVKGVNVLTNLPTSSSEAIDNDKASGAFDTKNLN